MTEKYSNLNTKYQKTTNLLFYCFSAFTIIVIVWSFIFQIDIVSNAEGQVIPVGEVKTIQHLEGGIIEKILVKESEYVETGQPLVVLAATASEVDVEELQVRMDTQIIKSVRLEAEINNFEVPIFPDSLSQKREKIIIEIDRFKAINESIKFANKEDIVLIAGKGHEDYQILNDKVIDFDDRKIAYKLSKEKNKSQ